MQRAPERHLRDVEADVALQQRLDEPVAHALPAERDLGGVAPPARGPPSSPRSAPGADHRPRAARPGVSASRNSRLATLRRTWTEPTAR